MTEITKSATLAKNVLGDKEKGSYVLLIKLPEGETITVGSLKNLYFPRGYYAYVGSALRGLKSRLSHYLKDNKKLHWHIDYLLQRASITDVVLCPASDRAECAIAQALSRQFDSFPGFGASDCKCHSHLFFATEEMRGEITRILNSLGRQPALSSLTALLG